MKPFNNTARYFAQHGANISFRLAMALIIVLAAATIIPGMMTLVPFVIAGVAAVYTFTHLFTGKRAEGLTALTTQADIFGTTQLQQKAIVLAGIYQHYGWRQDTTTGQWIKPDGARDIPEFLDKLRITRKDIFNVVYLAPGQDTFKFFQSAQGNGSLFFNNMKEINLPSNKMYLMFGIVGELGTGASAADTPDILDFKTPVPGTDEEVVNGVFSLKTNTVQQNDNTLYKTAFVNDDAVKNYYRFPEPIVWEPGSGIELELKLCKAYAASTWKFQRMTIIAFELVK